jgi:hypothetical protein
LEQPPNQVNQAAQVILRMTQLEQEIFNLGCGYITLSSVLPKKFINEL